MDSRQWRADACSGTSIVAGSDSSGAKCVRAGENGCSWCVARRDTEFGWSNARYRPTRHPHQWCDDICSGPGYALDPVRTGENGGSRRGPRRDAEFGWSDACYRADDDTGGFGGGALDIIGSISDPGRGADHSG
jgi:hypothetical protein